jgi:hypothetical protein
MHGHLLQPCISPRIGLICEQFDGNCFGTFRNSPNTAAPEGWGWGVGRERGLLEKVRVHGGGLEANGSIPEQPCPTSVGSPLRRLTQTIWP